MTALRPDSRLPCGTEVAHILERVADRQEPTAHQRGCPYCTAAWDELADLWVGVRAYADEEVFVPDGFVMKVMRRVRASSAASRREVGGHSSVARRRGWHALWRDELGELWIADRVVAAVVAQTLTEVEGFERIAGPGGIRVRVGRREVIVEVRVVLVYGQSVVDIVAAVQERVSERVQEVTGLLVVSLDVVVTGFAAGDSTRA